MTHELIAQPLDAPHPIRLRWQNGLITGIEPQETPRPDLPLLLPPLFDVQVNGFGGVDFQQDGLRADDLLPAVAALAEHGCSEFLLTLITAGWPSLLERLRHLRRVIRSHPALSRAVAGWHIEGPFLSEQPGFHGAHDPRKMLDPRPEHLEDLAGAVEGDRLMLTVAPERPGALEFIRAAVGRGWVISLGHTNAPAETLRAAIAAGASCFTHLGNGCPQTLDRHDNILWRVLDQPPPWVCLIPDGLHVAPPLLRLMTRLLGERLVLTTDAMSAAGAPPGTYRLGALALHVGAEGVVREPGKSNFAGSALTPYAGIKLAMIQGGAGFDAAWRAFSLRPRKMLSVPDPLRIGSPATFALLDRGTEADPGNLYWYRQGERTQ